MTAPSQIDDVQMVQNTHVLPWPCVQAGAILKLSPLQPSPAPEAEAPVPQPKLEPAATSTFVVPQPSMAAGPGQKPSSAAAPQQAATSWDLAPEAAAPLSRASSSHAVWHAQQEEQAKDLMNSLAALRLSRASSSRAASRRSSVAVSQTFSGRPSDVPTPELFVKPEQPAASGAASRSMSPPPASMQRRMQAAAAPAPAAARPVSPAPASVLPRSMQTATASVHQHVPGASPFRGLSNALSASGPSLTPSKTAATRTGAPMVSPLRMPARRVAPAGPCAASEAQAALELVVEQECLIRPSKVAMCLRHLEYLQIEQSQSPAACGTDDQDLASTLGCLDATCSKPHFCAESHSHAVR